MVSHHPRVSYRPALDGLRAVAVLGVLVYHVRPSLLPGGWLGVDVFFVLSGYLITSLLVAEYRNWQSISLREFWLRRARRLLPALIVVIGAVLLTGAFLTLPDRRDDLARDSVAALFYVANWRFLLSDEAYFAGLASPSPLRHMWSLGVEEQFYILFPLLFIVLVRVLRSVRLRAILLLVLAVASAVLMALLHDPGIDPSRVYYGTDTRAFELLLGGACAVVVKGRGDIPKTLPISIDRWARRLAPIALLAVLVAMVFVTEDDSFAFEGGLFALALSTLIVIVAAASPNGSATQRILSAEPLRRIGLISYGLYLWHWPVVVFATSNLLGYEGLALQIIQVGISLALAQGSYVLIERPIRTGGFGALVPRAPVVGRLIAVLAVAAVAIGIAFVPRTTSTVASPPQLGGDLTITAPAYRAHGATRTVLLVGNSVPESLFVTLEPGRYPDLDVRSYTRVGCELLEHARINNDRPQQPTNECVDWLAGLDVAVDRAEPDVALVFLSHTMLTDREVDGRTLTFGSAEHNNYLESQWTRIADRLRSAGARHVVLMNLACHRIPLLRDDTEVSRTNDDQLVEQLNALAERWSAGNRVEYVDEYSLLCGSGYSDRVNGTTLYSDYMHFTTQSSAHFWAWLAPQLQAIAFGTSAASQ